MRICQNINPEAFDFVPKTFIYPLEQVKLKEFIKENPGSCFIAKPSNGLKGKDIFLMRDMQDIEHKIIDKNKSKTDYIV